MLVTDVNVFGFISIILINFKRPPIAEFFSMVPMWDVRDVSEVTARFAI
jgi:hypothetical protein